MKKTNLLSIFLFVSAFSAISAQSKNYIGIGPSIDFSRSIATSNGNVGLQPVDSNFSTFSLHSFLNLNTDKLFQLRVNTRLNAKQIRLASDDLVDFGGVMIDRYQSNFVSFDMGLTGLYAIPIGESTLLPAFGVFGSYNLSTRGFAIGRENDILTFEEILSEPQRTNRPMVAYLGFNAGLVCRTKTPLSGNPIEFYLMVYFSGMDSFEATYEYENIDSLTYKGRNRTIALGFNIPIIFKRNQVEKEG